MLLFSEKKMMKNIAVLLLVVCCFSMRAFGQNRNVIPPFKMRVTNGNIFTPQQLRKGVPVMLIYFSPECEHCQALTKQLSASMSRFHHKEIILMTYFPMAPVVEYDKAFGLSRNSNVHIGSEGYTFVVQKFYQVQKFPFVALFNSNGRLVKTFSKLESPTLILNAFNSLR